MMKTKSKLRPYVTVGNAIIMGVVFFTIPQSFMAYISLLGMLALIIINYLDGHFEKGE